MTKKTRGIILAGSLAAVLTIGGSLAYFTDGDTAVNNFTVGRVSIDLREPGFEEDDQPPLVPDQEVVKDPQVKNDGINDAYIFAVVTVPYANVKAVSEAGALSAAANTQLFTYNLDSSWTLVSSGTLNGKTLASTSAIAKATAAAGYVDTTAKTVSYAYAYTGSSAAALEKVAAGDTTENVFPAVKLINVAEDTIEETAPSVTVTAYAIQADMINNGDTTVDGTNASGKNDPASVWAIIQASQPETDDQTGEDTATDIKA